MKLLRFRDSAWDIILPIAGRILAYEVDQTIRNNIRIDILWNIRREVYTRIEELR